VARAGGRRCPINLAAIRQALAATPHGLRALACRTGACYWKLPVVPVPVELSPDPDSKLDPVLPVPPVEPVLPVDPMFGHGCPEWEPWPGIAAPGGAADVELDSAVEVLDCVVVAAAPLLDVGAAAAPAIPAIAPPDASAPVMIATFTAFEGFIGTDLLGRLRGTPTMLGGSRKENARWV
jgi:hypothetical protein